MILKYALFRAKKLLTSVTRPFTVSKTQTFPGKLFDSIVLTLFFFGSDVPLSLYFPLVGFKICSRETEALCTTLPEELEVFDEDPFDEEVAIFYLKAYPGTLSRRNFRRLWAI